MTDLRTEMEQLRAEAREKMYKGVDEEYWSGRYSALNNALSFIDSLKSKRKEKWNAYVNAKASERRNMDLSFLEDGIRLSKEELDYMLQKEREATIAELKSKESSPNL